MFDRYPAWRAGWQTARLSPVGLVNRTTYGLFLIQALHTFVSLDIPTLVGAGPRSAADLAAACGADEVALFRLLRYLAGEGYLTHVSDDRFGPSLLSRQLQADGSAGLRQRLRVFGSPWFWQSCGRLLDGVKTGEPPLRLALGQDLYDWLGQHPEEGAEFDRMMTVFSDEQYPLLVASFDFRPYATICDVAGGGGALLAAILAVAPQSRGVLFDQPHVLADPAALAITACGDRATVESGSFFEAVPAGADLYVMKSIIHNWDDAAATAILKTCRRAMAPSARLLIIDSVVPAGGDRHMTKTSDLIMLILTPGGRERTEAEYRRLFEGAGFRLAAIRDSRLPLLGLLELVPA
jgi:hypothetical protein